MSNYLTFHILNALPMHNANRDDNGAPKSIRQGGVLRGILSSQSLKRAARVAFEEQMANDRTFRSSTGVPDMVMNLVSDLAAEHGVEVNEKKARTEITKAIKSLTASKDESKTDKPTDGETKGSGKKGSKKKDTNVWLSRDEIGALALRTLEVTAKNAPGDILDTLGNGNRTGALSIAAFGRMFANANDRQTEAAIAVAPAITTHKLTIDIDYFTVVDDLSTGSGASFLDVAQYTNGVYYRTFTIDRAQLQRSWSDINAPDARERLSALIRSLIYSLPQGKKSSTAPSTTPLIVLAEEQTVRQGYAFERPVAPDENGGGFDIPSVTALVEQHNSAVAFDPKLFSNTYVAASVAHPEVEGAQELGNLDAIIARATDWVLNGSETK